MLKCSFLILEYFLGIPVNLDLLLEILLILPLCFLMNQLEILLLEKLLYSRYKQKEFLLFKLYIKLRDIYCIPAFWTGFASLGKYMI